MFRRPDTPAIITVVVFSIFASCFSAFCAYQLNSITKWQETRDDLPSEIEEIKNILSDIKELKTEVVPRAEHEIWRNEFFKLNPELVRP